VQGACQALPVGFSRGVLPDFVLRITSVEVSIVEVLNALLEGLPAVPRYLYVPAQVPVMCDIGVALV
jgi:hypothetical protein